MYLKVENTKLPLPQGYSVLLQIVTNVLNLEVTKPNYTYPIHFPVNDVTAKFFGYPEEFKTNADLSKIYDNVSLGHGGIDYFKGALQLLKAGKYGYDCTFRFATGYVTTLVKNVKLKEFFDTDTIRIEQSSYGIYEIDWSSAIVHDRYEVSLNGFVVVQNYSLSVDDSLTDLAGTINALTEVNSCTYNAVSGVMTLTTLPGYAPTVTAEGTDLGEDPTPYTVSQIDRALTRMHGLGEKFFLPTMYIPNLFDGLCPNYSGFVNLYSTSNGNRPYLGTDYYDYQRHEDPFQVSDTLIPCISRKWLIQRFATKLGMRWEGDWFDDINLSQTHEFVAAPIDAFIYSQAPADTIDFEVPLWNWLPDITIGEWLKSFKVIGCASITSDFDSRKLSVNLIKNIMTSDPVMDLTPYLIERSDIRQEEFNGLKIGYGNANEDLRLETTFEKVDDMNYRGKKPLYVNLGDAILAGAQPGDTWFVNQRNLFYKLESPGAWVEASENFDDYNETERKEEIRTIYVPLADTIQTVDGETIRVPFADVVGWSIPHGLKERDFTPRISIYRGIQESVQGNDYPMSSNIPHTANEAYVPGWVSLSPDYHDQSMIKEYYQPYLNWKANEKRCEILLKLSNSLVRKMKPNASYWLGGVKVLVEEMAADITDGDYSDVQATVTFI